ncbi:MAG: PaaI family thioesterase [Alphaproteobacteria bacterium]|jgi:uncharacterized protein (TIGR00369 family)|nr:PaaI family thioesterase [Alphaproteobacteria bacterium]MBT4020079.1 PaaI family thioesterase [Alphaproteobacteria bacterium]MBT4965359.1 PaaI family thioesterase [Alphaproteobacteria bacterium]MBT5158145.1 PaaI family thioesterase [Alphaproteobacteria bacterium]MBT5919674.1 PaaI family thioesterase [Alphaproteobacteria bacterium]
MSNFEGADFFAIATRFVEAIPHVSELGIGVVSAAPGSAVIKLPYQNKLIGNPDTGVLHGGVITTLIDTVCGFAAFSDVGDGLPLATLDLRIDYLKPATPGIDLLAEGHTYKKTKSIMFVRATAYHDDPNDPIANCVCAFMRGTKGVQFVGSVRKKDAES